jgi:hypothetical protein
MEKMSVIPMLDYLRIFNMTRAILDGTDADTFKACIFFSTVGAAILQKCYRKNATAVAGAAVYHVSSTPPNGLAFAHIDPDGKVSCSDTRFHAWVQCDNMAIDFAAPLFPEYYAEFGSPGLVPRKMFQKPLTAMAPMGDGFARPGDFYLQPDHQRTAEIRESFASSLEKQDLVNACLTWYRRPPLTMPNQLKLVDDQSDIVTFRMRQMQVSGAW